jgi:hypothetical protein
MNWQSNGHSCEEIYLIRCPFLALVNLSGRNVDWGCLRTGCWGEYLDRREVKWREVGENSTMGSFITYSSPSIIRMIKLRRIRWTGHVARMAAKRIVYGILMRKPEGNRPLGRRRHRWVDNIKILHREIGWGSKDWTDWLRIGTNRGIFRTRKRTFGFHKMLGSSWVVAQLAVSQEGLISEQLFTWITSSVCIALAASSTSVVRSPAGRRNYSPLHIAQLDSGAHPASYPMGTSGSFPGG